VRALAAPRGTPKSVVDRLYAAVQSSLREASLKDRYEQLGMVPVGNAPAELAARIRTEAAAWGEFIRARNIGID